jgi:hypothetical protein
MFGLFQKRSIKVIREDDLIDFIEAVRFFAPSPELTLKIAERLKFLIEREKPFLKEATEKIDSTKEMIDGQKKMISEQLFAYLAIKADSKAALSKESLPISRLFGFGFGKSIGLSNEEEDAELLSDLSKEFFIWIERIGSFPTGWGEIEFDGDQYVKLLRKNEIPQGEVQQNQIIKVKTRRFSPVKSKAKTAKG